MRTALPGAVRFVAAAALLFAGSCAEEQPGRVAPEISASTLPHPVLDEMEPIVARALEAQRSEVDALLERRDASETERAREIGRLGQLYQAHRLLEAAEACYREAHALDPEVFDWAYYLGVLAARRGNIEAAIGAFEDAIKLRPLDLPARVRLADLELDRGRIDRARSLYEAVRSQEPSLAVAEYGLGRAAAESESYQEAVEHFDRALALQPRASVVNYHLGQAYRQLRMLDRAERYLAQSGPVKVAMPDPLMSSVNALAEGTSPYLIQGNTALRDGRISVAAKAFRMAIEVDPDNVMARKSLATVLTLLGDSDGAVEQLEAAAELAPANAQAQSDLGTALAERGEDERAVEHLRRAIEIEPTLQQTRFNLANTLARQRRFADAEGHYRRLLEIDPDHLVARSRLGTVLAQAGKLTQAIAELRRVVKQSGDDAEAHINLGIALAETGDLEGAVEQHRKALDLSADNAIRARANFNLGTFALREKDPRRALGHFQAALDTDDRLVPAHLNVAKLLAAAGRLEASLPHFARVRELDPGHEKIRLSEATVLMRLGRFGDAKRVLEEAVQRRPADPSSAHALARLLSAAPDPALRDGGRAMALMAQVLEAATIPSYVETQAMALAEVGRFEDAAGKQRAVLAEVRRRGLAADAERVARNLRRYEREMTCCAEARDAATP